MKRFKKYLILFIISAFLGILFSFLKHNGYMFLLKEGLKSIKWYFYPLIILFVFFLNILIHELGHLFSFLFNGIKIRALYVLIFILMKDSNNKWKFKIKLSNLKLIGGIVVPNMETIKSEEELNKNRKAFEKALIAGPNTSIAYFIISTLLFIIFWFTTSFKLLIGLLFLNNIITLIMTILIVLSSKANTSEMYGDYVARKLFKEDDSFALVQLIQYSSFSLNDMTHSDLFFFNYLTEFYIDHKLTYNFFDLILATNFLSIYLYNDSFKYNRSINKIITYYDINRLARSKHGLELAYLISAVNYKKNSLKKSFEIYNLINIYKNSVIDLKKQEFFKKQYAHLINLENNSNYFINNEEFIKEELFILEPLFNINELILDYNKTLEFKEYFTKLYCKI